MEHNYQQDPGYKAAQQRVKDIKGFYIHLVVYLFINVAILVVHSHFNQPDSYGLKLSNFYTPILWGLGLAAHWASVFGPGKILGEKWEEKKIKELMEKDKERRQKWE